MTLRRHIAAYLSVNAAIVALTGVAALAPLWLTLGWAALLAGFVSLIMRRGDRRHSSNRFHEGPSA